MNFTELTSITQESTSTEDTTFSFDSNHEEATSINMATYISNVNSNNCGDKVIKKDDVFQGGFLFRFWCNILLVPILVVIGITGNVLSIIIIKRVNFGFPSTKVLIRSLAVFDILYLLGSLFFQTLRGIQLDTDWMGDVYIYQYIHAYVWPYMTTVQTAETWVVVCMAVDRFVAVQFPLHASSLCTRRRAIIVVVIIAICSFLYSFPHFFEFKADGKFDECINKKKIAIKSTDLFLNKTYQIVYWSAITLALRFIIPLVALIFLTVGILLGIRKASNSRKKLTESQIGESSGNSRRNTVKGSSKDNATPVLISVVVVFVLCETIEFAMHVLTTMRWVDPAFKARENAQIQGIANTLGNLMLVVNASVNFMLYVAFAKVFKQGLKDLCCGGRAKTYSQSDSRSHENVTSTVSLDTYM